MRDAPPELPRWVQVLIGLLILPVLVLCLGVSALFTIVPPEKNTLLVIVAGWLMVVVSLWGIAKAVRLIFGWRTHGGLIGPTALRVIGTCVLLLPLAGLFTGHYARWGLLPVFQACLYVSLSFGLFRLARASCLAGAPPGTQPDGPASGESAG